MAQQDSEIDFWAIKYEKTRPFIPAELVGSREEVIKKGLFSKPRMLKIMYCLRCGEILINNRHICKDVYYYIWNTYIDLKGKQVEEFITDKVKEKYSF
jgi:hypothetical protein